MARPTVIGAETRVCGPLESRDDVEIAGAIDGPVRGEATVTIHKGARIGGEVRGRDVVLAGRLDHRIYATGTVRLTATAELRADIEAPRIAIDEGALFEGQVRMVRAAPPPAAKQVPVAAPVLAAVPVAANTPSARAIPEISAPTKKRLVRKSP